jgi:hypothetical protein
LPPSANSKKGASAVASFSAIGSSSDTGDSMVFCLDRIWAKGRARTRNAVVSAPT